MKQLLQARTEVGGRFSAWKDERFTVQHNVAGGGKHKVQAGDAGRPGVRPIESPFATLRSKERLLRARRRASL